MQCSIKPTTLKIEAFVSYETFATNYKTILSYSSLHFLAVACCVYVSTHTHMYVFKHVNRESYSY